MTKRMRFLAIVGAAIVVIGLTLSLCGWTPLALLSYVMKLRSQRRESHRDTERRSPIPIL